MATEYVVGDSIVANLLIKAPALPATEPSTEPWFRRLARLLRGICSPNEGDVKLFEGQPLRPVYANNLDPDYSCSWVDKGNGRESGHVVLAWADQPNMRVRVEVQFRIAKDGSKAWLTVGYNPTSLTVGHNVHPAAFIDPQTGVAHPWPSSSWAAMTRAFRLGFTFLETLSEPEPLFDAATKRVIARGDVHLVSVQHAATKAAPNVPEFLQVGTAIYGQTIARGQGIINNADHLGLEFEPFEHEDPNENRLSGFTLKKRHGKKSHVSVSFYDKLVRVLEMHQETTLSLAEVQTVDQSVREDITAHSSFILTIVNAAREKLANMDEADRKFFDVVSPEEFLRGTPKSTVWWLQRAIFLLSHRRGQGRWVRHSFATWLIPFVEKHVLHLDVVASITTRGYHALYALDDEVAAAWRSDPTPGASDWAGRLARIAGCQRSTVYNRRDEWRQKYGIDIARPLQMYSDILYFGHNSIAKPESITALVVALHYRKGDKVVRLHAEAIADFERKRTEIVNPALVSAPRAMELNLPPIKSPPIASPEVHDVVDFEDIDADDLDQAFPNKPVSARPTIASASAKSQASQVEQESVTEPRKTIVLRAPRSPPPPPTAGRKVISRARRSPPPTTRTKIILPAMPSPPPPPTRKKLILRGTYSPSLPPPGKKVSLLGTYSAPPPSDLAGHSQPAAAVDRKKVRLRAMPSPPPPTRKRVVLRGPCPAHRRRPKGGSSCGSGAAHRLHRP
jgi:hypothetical protein